VVGSLLIIALILVSVLQKRTDPTQQALILGGIALLIIGFFDHYPWTMLHYQTILVVLISVK
jgi:hypothetical protein